MSEPPSSSDTLPVAAPAAGALLLVDDERSVSSRLELALAAAGFSVTTAGSLAIAERLIGDRRFDFAVIDMRLEDGYGMELVRQLQEQKPRPRIIVITGYDSVAESIVALRAGAVDYLPKPVNTTALIHALRGEPAQAGVPDVPLSADRIKWEHIHRIYEQCGRNVSETARRLGMHRRTLQRIMTKRAPRDRR